MMVPIAPGRLSPRPQLEKAVVAHAELHRLLHTSWSKGSCSFEKCLSIDISRQPPQHFDYCVHVCSTNRSHRLSQLLKKGRIFSLCFPKSVVCVNAITEAHNRKSMSVQLNPCSFSKQKRHGQGEKDLMRGARGRCHCPVYRHTWSCASTIAKQ